MGEVPHKGFLLLYGDGNNVKEDLLPVKVLGAQVSQRCGRYPLLLDGINLVTDGGGDGSLAGFHFHEVKAVRALRNYVYLQMSGPPVAVQDVLASGFQEIAGHLLSKFS